MDTPLSDDQFLALASEDNWIFPHEFGSWAFGGRFKAWRHLQYISEEIAEAVYRGNGRLIVNMPPRHGKSVLTSLVTPVWYLNRFPERNILLCSYGDEMATEWGRRVRNEARDNPRLSFALADDSKSAKRFNTAQGGGMTCAGVGGAITGRGGNLNLIDDPIKSLEEAFSQTHRQRVVEWFESDFYTRLEPNATVVINMHRWHPEDLTGYLVEEHADDWRVISFPALAEANDPLGREIGEALCPERYSAAQLHQVRLGVGESVWHPRYQQNASGMRKARTYDHFADSHIRRDISWDPALPIALVFDFNINPGMHCYLGQYSSHADEFRVMDEIHGLRMSVQGAVTEAIKRIDALPWVGHARRPEIEIYGDATGESETVTRAESSFAIIRSALRSRPNWIVRMKVPRRNPPIVDRVNATNDALRDFGGGVHVAIHPRCSRLIRDYREVKPGDNEPIDKSNPDLTHASDAVGYWIVYRRPAGGRLMIPRGRISTAR